MSLSIRALRCRPLNHCKSCHAGFTLLELSIVLLIMSIILGAGINLLAIRTEAARVNDTKHKMEVIQQAIAAYFTEYHRLPCPAIESLTVNASQGGLGFGAEYVTGNGSCGVTSVSNGDPTQTPPNGTGIGTMGSVPTRTLQIDDDYQFDGWNRHIDYNMNELCASSVYPYGTIYPPVFPPAVGGGIPTTAPLVLPAGGVIQNSVNFNNDVTGCTGIYTIQDGSHNARTTSAIFVLVSHGKDGHGAYNYAGNALSAGNQEHDADQDDHMDQNGVYLANNGVFIQKAPIYNSASSAFSDIISYTTKDKLLADTGVFKGMAGSVVAPSDIDPVCNMIDQKLGTQYPAVVTFPNPPNMSAMNTICGTPANGNSYANPTFCAGTFNDLAYAVFLNCY